MNKQPTPRICMTGCFRLTEEYVSPAQKFRVLSAEAVERRDAESPRCNSSEKEQVWLRYIKCLSEIFRCSSREERAEVYKAGANFQRAYHLQEEAKLHAVAEALKNLLSALENGTAEELMRRMGEKGRNED